MSTYISESQFRQTYVECDGCDEENEVHWYCLSCKSSLCDKCTTVKLHRNHVVRAWTDPSSIKARQDAPVACAKHYEESYVTYCTSCSCLCCGTCVAECHSGHHFSAISITAEKSKENVQKVIDALKSKTLPQARKFSSDIKRHIHANTQESQARRNKIQNKILSLKKKIEHMEKTLMQEEDCASDDYVDRLNKQLVTTKEKTNMIETRMQQVEMELCLWNRVRFIKVGANFLEWFEHLATNHVYIPTPPQFIKSSFNLPDAKVCVGTILQSPDPKSTSGEQKSMIVHKTIPKEGKEKNLGKQENVVEKEQKEHKEDNDNCGAENMGAEKDDVSKVGSSETSRRTSILKKEGKTSLAREKCITKRGLRQKKISYEDYWEDDIDQFDSESDCSG